MNRLDRITAILIQLQSKRIVKGQEIADRFGINLRTVYRDLASLKESGVPINGEPGIGYSLVDGYRLPPVMFTLEEVSALLTAEKLIGVLGDASTSGQFNSAMYKIRAVLRISEKDNLSLLDNHIEVIGRTKAFQKTRPDNILQPVYQSILRKQVISILYQTKSQNTEIWRNIEPLGVCFIGGYWHIIAYCQLRKDYRDFRIDRMRGIKETTMIFQAAHFTLKEYLVEKAKKEALVNVTIMFNKSVLTDIEEQRFYYGFVQQEKRGDDKVEMTFLTPSLERFAKGLLLYDDTFEVVSPPELVNSINNYINFLKNKFS
jgi:predicted DNA-binding transcriptional regulator YafY